MAEQIRNEKKLRPVRPGPTEARGEIGRQLGARLADVPEQPLPEQLSLRLELLNAVEQRRDRHSTV